MPAWAIVDRSLVDVIAVHWPIERVTEWNDAGHVLVVFRHERMGVYDLVIDGDGVRLKPDADV